MGIQLVFSDMQCDPHGISFEVPSGPTGSPASGGIPGMSRGPYVIIMGTHVKSHGVPRGPIEHCRRLWDPRHLTGLHETSWGPGDPMACSENPQDLKGIPIDSHGFPWIPMGFCGSPWVLTKSP